MTYSALFASPAPISWRRWKEVIRLTFSPCLTQKNASVRVVFVASIWQEIHYSYISKGTSTLLNKRVSPGLTTKHYRLICIYIGYAYLSLAGMSSHFIAFSTRSMHSSIWWPYGKNIQMSFCTWFSDQCDQNEISVAVFQCAFTALNLVTNSKMQNGNI